MKNRILIVFSLVSLSAHTQKINQDDLYTFWHLDKYSDEEQYYHPPKKEAEDYLGFNRDMTYTVVSEGKKAHGTWLLNTNGKYIELLSGEGKKEKLYIYFLSNRSLVVAYDADKYRLWEVHYVSLNREGK